MAKTKTKKKNVSFEVHINKQKMKVLGQKLKHDRGLPGVSRAKAINKRKRTLLQEFKLMNKSNRFLDKRIGEKNSGFTEEDRAMARYAAVRMKTHKKASIFNLANDEVLTHKGQTLNEIEKFDDPKSDTDDDTFNDRSSGKLESDFVGDAHFGGGVLTDTGSDGFKSHKDLINQLIAESKKRKAERMKAKENTLELTEKLDEEWKDLIPLVNPSIKTAQERVEEKATSTIDDYDKMMRELRFEARGIPSNRLKGEEEIAKEEKEKLERLEKERLNRMKGIFQNASVNVVAHRSADDLDDDFEYDSEPEVTLTYNEKGESNIVDVSHNRELQNEADEGNEESEDDEDNEESEHETASEDDLSDLKNESSSDEEEITAQSASDANDDVFQSQRNISVEINRDSDGNEINETKMSNIRTDLKRRKEIMEKARKELPYTFKLPESYCDLQELLKHHSPEFHSVIMERMIKCNHSSLAESNKEKLALLFVYLLQYVDDLHYKDDIIGCFNIFSALVPHFFNLAEMNPENAQNSILEVVKEKQKDYRKNIKRYPGCSVLLFLKLISCLFPTSDFRHPVVTPAVVFIDQMLFKCKVRTRRDIAYGFFLVTLILEYTSLSKRYLPSALNFLAGLLHMTIPKNSVQLVKVLPPFKSTSNNLVLQKNNFIKSALKLEPTDLIEDEIAEDFKVRILYNSLKVISEFNENFKEFPCNKEIFFLISKYLKGIPIHNYDINVQEEMKNLLNSLHETTDKKLFYIVTELKRPKALRLYEPNIQKIYDVKRQRVMSKEKAERAKLIHKIKMEKKGALREIRRDRSFLGRIKIKNRIQSDKQRQEKVKRIFAEANIQQSELNAMDRKNKKK